MLHREIDSLGELLRLILFIIISPVIGILFAVVLFFMGIFMLILFIEDLLIDRRYYEGDVYRIVCSTIKAIILLGSDINNNPIRVPTAA